MRFGLIWSEVGNGLRRNLSMVVSVVLVTFISLTFVGTAALLQLQIAQMKTYWYDRAQVAVYMCTETDNCPGGAATAQSVEAVKKQLESPEISPYIQKFYFQDQKQGYEQFKQQFKGNQIADYVTPEMIPQTFWVNLKDPNRSDVLTETLSSSPGVQSVVDQRSYLDQIFRILSAGSYTALGIAALMLVAAVLLIATTIRLSAFSRRREIGIMRLVGASNRFIQTPFIIEGVIAALIGAVLSATVIWVLVEVFVHGPLQASIPSINFVSMEQAWPVIPLVIVIGALLAALSANFAIKRYLRV
ncbi:permease-like cell division protein FtsX [Leifsonia sp. TF02-11]|uniref:permease-like cell division protein FtsX n=1 Tax=Leifsonia sp. TF02-11 TaxID=2815212 RepID=UPI001AA16E63|nr:permease-like cell division protein FtsX [Leifsonia sp. TF02-11]MBN9629146.1 ABC transporter permease [Actinomycetota bacterium]MBO1740835.1 permease-like cell division protein FtsX [Leifsonia sp. TF02-11]